MPDPSAVAVPSAVVPLVSSRVTVAPASAPVPVKVGVAVLIGPLAVAPLRVGSPGGAAVVSIVTANAVEGALVIPPSVV